MTNKIIDINIINEAKILMGKRFPLMIKYFTEDTKAYLAEIARACVDRDIKIALLPAHTIKSSAKQMGIMIVSEIAEQIELLCQNMIKNNNENYTELDNLYHQLNKEVAVALPELDKFCER